MNKPQTLSFYRRNLPHWHVVGRPYFVTFRLKGSIPKQVLLQIRKERKQLLQINDTQKIIYARKRFAMIEKILDSSSENNHLNNSKTANIIIRAFEWAETKHSWKFYSYVIMPNHVHCLMSGSNSDNDLTEIMQIIKGFTSHEINKTLNRKGAFWAPEIFDHWCRTPEKVESVIRYIHNNPVKAKLVKNFKDWPWIK